MCENERSYYENERSIKSNYENVNERSHRTDRCEGKLRGSKSKKDGSVTKAPYVEVPEEDQTEEYKVCGRLEKAMYGTRQAAAAWQREVESTMGEIDMHPGISSPCVFHHSRKNLRAVIHGDDFTLLGKRMTWTGSGLRSAAGTQ